MAYDPVALLEELAKEMRSYANNYIQTAADKRLDALADRLETAIAQMRAPVGEPNYWFVMRCPGWPGGYALSTKEAALQFIRENGNENTRLASWHEQFMRYDYSPEELAAMQQATDEGEAK